MKDEQKGGALHALFADAQRDFDVLAREYTAACEAFEAAQRARAQAYACVSASFNEIQGLMRVLYEDGPLPPLRMEESATYLAFEKLRDTRELHADLAPLPGECPDPSSN